MSAAAFNQDAFSRILDPSQLRPGGSPTARRRRSDRSIQQFVPPYDVVIERKTRSSCFLKPHAAPRRRLRRA